MIAQSLRTQHVAGYIPIFLVSFVLQVRLHILLQLDGLAEWMPAMAEQVSARFLCLFRHRQAFGTTPTRSCGGLAL